MDFYQFPTSLGLMALASEGDFITHPVSYTHLTLPTN